MGKKIKGRGKWEENMAFRIDNKEKWLEEWLETTSVKINHNRNFRDLTK